MNPNGIKKNDPILVTRDNGEVWVGKATKVAPWTKNPKITVVTFISSDENGDFRCTADARRCTIAPADALPKEAETHPIMAKWSLGKTKRGPEMMEGYYYSVPVLLNGKKVGEIIDEGNGGGNFTRFKDHTLEIAFNADCKAWAKANGDDSEYEHASEFWGWWEEAKPKGKDAVTYFKEKKERMLKWMAGQSA